MAALATHGAHERLVRTLPPATLLKVRKVLRRLRHDADALVVVLDVRGEVVDLVGDNQFLPCRLPFVDRAVPCLERAKLRDGTEGRVGVLRIRLLRGWPSLGLHLVEPGDAAMERISELLERAGEDIEDLVLPMLGT